MLTHVIIFVASLRIN